MIGRSKQTFHSGLSVLLIVGVDCLASPRVTTRYCCRQPESLSLGRFDDAYWITGAALILSCKISSLDETVSASDTEEIRSFSVPL